MTLLNLLDINMVSGPSSGLVELPRIWRNLKVTNIWSKVRTSPAPGTTGAIITKNANLSVKEYLWDDNELIALDAGHTSAIKLKNAKAALHSVVASGRGHKDDEDDDADGEDADGSGANWRAATKVDKQVATMTPWISSCAFKSMLLDLIARGLHEREVNPIYCHWSLFLRTNRQLRFLSELKQAQWVSEDVLSAMICTEKEELNAREWTSPIQWSLFLSQANTACSVSRLETNAKFERRSPLGNQPGKVNTQ
jgi:hypothetical protein